MPKPVPAAQQPRHKTSRRAPGNLPFTLLSDPTPLIGRDRELDGLRHLLLDDSVRLVTVLGPGGVGKTRLAVAAARSVENAFPDGVCFIDLAPLHDPTHIDAAIGAALDLRDVGAHSPRELVTAYLRSRRLLLVLDNFEQVLPAANRIAELLTTCPHLRVLVTSREPLRLSLEHRLLLPGLEVPMLDRASPASVAKTAAGALFLERARLVQPDFVPTPDDARALAELLRRLDGMPLAIQITAARSNVLSPSAMLTRLRGQVLLSTEEASDVPPRHHTLRDAVDWSYALLDGGEQESFRQLGLFAGGWTLEAAEGIVQSRDPGTPVWQTLRSLVEKNLVQTDATGGTDRRYRLLDVIREYALERLVEAGDVDTARERHAGYYLMLAERAEPEWWGPDEQTWLRRIELEHDNLRAALRWALEQADGALSLRLAAALVDFWLARAYLREGRRWLEQALARNPASPPALRAKALAGAGSLVGLLGDVQAARELLRQAVELAASDSAATARALSRLGLVAMYEDDPGGAEAVLERSLALFREGHDLPWQALTLLRLGMARLRLGDLDRSEATLTESLALSRTVGNMRLEVSVTIYLAQIKLQRRDDAGAAALAAEALAAAREGALSAALWVVVSTTAVVSAHGGDFDRAVRLLAAMDRWSESTGHVFVFGTAAPEVREKITAGARQAMGDSAYKTAVTEGHALSAGGAVDLARTALERFAPAGPEQTGVPDGGPSSPLLSDREQEVLRLVAEGLPNKQIATALSIAPRTVTAHLTSAMNKLGVDNRAHAAVVAIRRGLL